MRVRSLLQAWALALMLPLACGDPSASGPAPHAIGLTHAVVNLNALGATATVSAVVLGTAGDTLSLPVTWSSSNPSVCQLAPHGYSIDVTALANGSAQITVTAGTISRSFQVTVVQLPHAIVITGGANQTLPLSSQLNVSARLDDSLGNLVGGFPVSLDVISGGGTTSSAQAISNSNGVVTTTWSVGTRSGAHQLRIRAVPASAVVDATVLPGPATVITVPGVSYFRGQTSQPLPRPIPIQVTDSYGNGVPGIAVAVAVASGGGSVSAGNLQTGSGGIATVAWTLGSSVGTQTLSASAASLSASPLTIPATAAASSPYFIDLRFVRSPGDSIRVAFEAAASHWENVITGDLADIDFRSAPAPAGLCTPNQPSIADLVDDLLVYVDIVPGDGIGKLNGLSGPCFIRTAGTLPVMGIAQLDQDDVQRLIDFGSLRPWAFHELGHVLGFGTLWDVAPFNCLLLPSSAASVLDTHMTCPHAVAVYDSLKAPQAVGPSVPVENCNVFAPGDCTAGFFNSHWRQWNFGEELMTGWLGTNNKLSRVTIASLADLGYTVNYSAADPSYHFVPPFLRSTGAAAPATLPTGDDVYRGPMFRVDEQGRVNSVVRRP